jgi:DNA mismatch endonuclease (patch repair protein)
MSATMDERPRHQLASKTDRVTYKGRSPASAQASAAARGSSKKVDTTCERALRAALWAAGYRYRKNVANIPGNPDIVFPRAHVVVFCDGDFWHGRDWESRSRKLKAGSNAEYWLAKIQRNMERDSETTACLEGMGWIVLRFWESEIRAETLKIVRKIGVTLATALDSGSKIP